MTRTTFACVLALGLALLAAAPAWAGEEVDGKGWSLRLPDGFAEAMSVESTGGFKITSRFGNLPIDGMPEIKAYTKGGGAQPQGIVMVARVDLTRTITSAEDLGFDRMDELREQLPEGFTLSPANVGAYKAMEIKMVQEGYEGDMVSRVLTIACGDYVVVVMLATDESAFANSAVMWADLRSSIEISPPLSKWVIFALIGIAALGAMFFLNRFGMRPAREVEDYAGRFQRFQDGQASTPFGGAHRPLQTGVRPKKLPSRPVDESRPDFRQPQPDPAQADARTPVAPPHAMGGSPARPPRPTPAPTATSPAVTRPAVTGPTGRPGLRTTRPTSGRWGS